MIYPCFHNYKYHSFLDTFKCLTKVWYKYILYISYFNITTEMLDAIMKLCGLSGNILE
jgi:hypothetical protein